MTPLSHLSRGQVARVIERMAIKRYISNRPTECFHRRTKIWNRLITRLPNAIPHHNVMLLPLHLALESLAAEQSVKLLKVNGVIPLPTYRPLPSADEIVTAIENAGASYG